MVDVLARGKDLSFIECVPLCIKHVRSENSTQSDVVLIAETDRPPWYAAEAPQGQRTVDRSQHANVVVTVRSVVCPEEAGHRCRSDRFVFGMKPCVKIEVASSQDSQLTDGLCTTVGVVAE